MFFLGKLRNLLNHLESFLPNSQLTRPVAYVGEMDHGGTFGIPNAWMASSQPGHGFWRSVYEKTVKGVREGARQDWIEKLTGPEVLYYSVKDWQAKRGEKDEVVVLKSPRIFPYSYVPHAYLKPGFVSNIPW
jgi:hypothetical protein